MVKIIHCNFILKINGLLRVYFILCLIQFIPNMLWFFKMEKIICVGHYIYFIAKSCECTILHFYFWFSFCSMITEGHFLQKKIRLMESLIFLRALSLTFYLNNYPSSLALSLFWFLVWWVSFLLYPGHLEYYLTLWTLQASSDTMPVGSRGHRCCSAGGSGSAGSSLGRFWQGGRSALLLRGKPPCQVSANTRKGHLLMVSRETARGGAIGCDTQPPLTPGTWEWGGASWPLGGDGRPGSVCGLWWQLCAGIRRAPSHWVKMKFWLTTWSLLRVHPGVLVGSGGPLPQLTAGSLRCLLPLAFLFADFSSPRSGISEAKGKSEELPTFLLRS